MDNRKILIMGGYGNTGRIIARLLLQESNATLVIGGRRIEKAIAAADEFNRNYAEQRVRGVYADASDEGSLREAFKDVDFAVIASSTAKYAREVAKSSLEAGIDYLDIQYSTKKISLLNSLSKEIEKAGRCFITDGGFHPGLPAALVRYAALHFDRLDAASVGSVIKIDWASLEVADATVNELVEELNDFQTLIYKDGTWKKIKMAGMADYLRMDFGREFGRQYCVPMFLEEMRAIPEAIPSIKETGFYVGGFNWFVDWLVMPIAMIALKRWPQKALKPTGRILRWGLNTFSKPPYGTLLKIEALGEKDGKARRMDITLSHEDGYVFTAIPVVACLLQYLDGSIRKPGLWTQANIVEPVRFFKDMQRMGIEIQTTTS